jgi:putative acetyltransferase
MELSLFNSSQSKEVIDLFTSVFSVSEGEKEGQLIGNLVSKLIATTDPQDLIGFVAISGDDIVGSIFFSRLVLSGEQTAFILSPVAIATNKQRKGTGQQLINFGISHLKSQGVNLVFTYGDPNFYSRVGFKPVSESIIKAPLKLSYPEGWLAQSLDGSPIKAIKGAVHCVEALNDQKYW